MKAFIGIALLLIAVVIVNGERCASTSNCQHVECKDGYQLACVFHECTCVSPGPTPQKCTMRSDCSGSCRGEWHCVDNVCRCTRS